MDTFASVGQFIFFYASGGLVIAISLHFTIGKIISFMWAEWIG